jgi:hypothetical protein
MLTLTYDDDYLPACGLQKSDFQKFMKRLRKEFVHAPSCRCGIGCVSRIRFYHCGEYGAMYGRPHYHALLFGFDFPDKRDEAMRRGYPVWRSPALERLWPFGISEIGTVTFDSAAYVARYLLKKLDTATNPYVLVDEDTGVVTDQNPEYATMSRRPGIGKPWFEKYREEVYPLDQVFSRGFFMKPPRAYDLWFEMVDAGESLEVARRRRRRGAAVDRTVERLIARDKVTQARVGRYVRSD